MVPTIQPRPDLHLWFDQYLQSILCTHQIYIYIYIYKCVRLCAPLSVILELIKFLLVKLPSAVTCARKFLRLFLIRDLLLRSEGRVRMLRVYHHVCMMPHLDDPRHSLSIIHQFYISYICPFFPCPLDTKLVR